MADSKTNDQLKHANVDIDGAFKRHATEFHDKVSNEANAKYPAEANRYHLYNSPACPWCHRVVMVIVLKGLQDVISISNVSPILNGLTHLGSAGYVGWNFNDEYPDPLHKNTKSTWDIYKIHDSNYPNSNITVPIFFDKKTEKIVCNESAEIIVFLNNAFNKFAKFPQLNLYPAHNKLVSSMNKWNDIIYPGINDGVYRCGFAESQTAYNDAVNKVFVTLDKMEKHLSKNRYFCGKKFTLTDIRAFVTLIRFDSVYFTHFKCNKKMIHQYPNLFEYTKEIYQMNGIKKTMDFKYTKKHYYASHKNINPFSIIPPGPNVNWNITHKRHKQIKNNKNIDVSLGWIGQCFFYC